MIKQFHNPSLKINSSKEINLDARSIVISADNSTELNIPLNELLGCKIFQSINKNFSPRMEVYFTNIKSKKHGKGGIDQLEHREIKTETIFFENINELKDLRHNILEKLYSHQKEQFIQKVCHQTNDVYYKKALVFLNPEGGKGKALHLYQKYKNYFEGNGISIDVVMTKPNPFTKEFIKNLSKEKLLNYDLIICFSGDGIVHTILNGFMSRNDIDFDNEKLTIVLMPSGSGCSLTENNMKGGKKAATFENVIHSICHFQRRAYSISKYDYLTEEGERGCIYGFLGLNYAFTYNIIVKSEKLRFLGNRRFGLYKMYEYFFMKSYNTVIYYCKEEDGSLPSITEGIEGDEFVINRNPIYFTELEEVEYISKDHRACPSLVGKESGMTNLQIFEARHGRFNMIKVLAQHKENNSDYMTEKGFINVVKKEYRIDLDPDLNKRNVSIDGENYSELRIRKLQKSISGVKFYSLT